MKAKNNISNKRKTSTRKKILKFRRLVTLLTLFIATIAVIALGSWKVISYGGKVLGTQIQLARAYSNIHSAQQAHDNYMNEASSYGNGQTAAYYVSLAEKEDAKIMRWKEIRSDLYHSDDPVVAEAAKNGFEFTTLLIGLACFSASIALWVLLLLFREKAFELFKLEVLLFDTLMVVFFSAFKFIFAKVVDICSFEFKFYNYYRKNSLAELKGRKKSGRKVVPITKKRKLG